ncbi:MAG: hypothetical protein QXX20_05835 [Candidatus Thermoplasmatota archaeon]
MEKKIIFLELPADVVQKIDEQNHLGTRSLFVSELIQRQLQDTMPQMQATPEIPTSMHAGELTQRTPGEISLVDSRGISLGTFNINTVEGFEALGKKICELSDDPIVRMKARRWR